MKSEKECVIKNIESVDLDKFEHASEVLASLSNRSRLAIVSLLLKYQEVCTCELESSLGLAQPTVTAHLLKLYSAGVLKKREVWRYTYYHVDPDMEPLVRNILTLVNLSTNLST